MGGLVVFLIVVSLIGLRQSSDREWHSFEDLPPKLQLILKVLGIAFGLIVLCCLPQVFGAGGTVGVIVIAVVIVVRIRKVKGQ